MSNTQRRDSAIECRAKAAITVMDQEMRLLPRYPAGFDHLLRQPVGIGMSRDPGMYLSNRDLEDLMAERGIAISYESIRLWCIKFGPKYAKRLRRRHQGYGDTFFIDEVFVKIQGKQHYPWRAVDQDGEVVGVFLQRRRDGKAAKRFFKRLLRASANEPRRIVTDKLRSYGVAHRELIPDTIHDTSQYANNRAELSHQPTRVRERGMRRFKFIHQAQRFLGAHAAVYNLFNLGRHLISAEHYRLFRQRAFLSWKCMAVS